jgi:tRNA-Thr(GGU) m(6)t(6)A37 methyltransferase TsaA
MCKLLKIGKIKSKITSLSKENPKMEFEKNAVKAQIEINPEYLDATLGLSSGDKIVLLTWLHKGARTTLKCHPRGDKTRPIKGVFATRSPSRPNPIGIHEVEIESIEGNMICVKSLEAIDGTPVIDIKKSILKTEGTNL